MRSATENLPKGLDYYTLFFKFIQPVSGQSNKRILLEGVEDVCGGDLIFHNL